MRKSLIWKFIISTSLILNFVLAIILFTPLTEQLYKPLIINDSLSKSEAIVVLAGDSYYSGLPGFRSLTRLKKALELYRDNWANKIICIGGTRLAKVNKSISEILKDTLILFGIPAQDILVYDQSFNTYDDISNLVAKFDRQFDFNKCIFVTSSFHTYRVKKVLEKKKITAAVVSAEPYELYPNFFTLRLDLFRMVIREYLAIYYFKTKGWI